MAMNYVKSEQQFINPYNFVPVDWKETRRGAIVKGELSGVLHCKLYTRTPLAIPELEEITAGHPRYHFMRDGSGKPYIPAASLRGPIRNIFETMTDSCFSTGKPKQIITKRAAMRESGKPCILKREGGKWKLYQARRNLLIMSDREYRPFSDSAFASAERFSREKLLEWGEGTKVYFSTLGLYISEKQDRKSGGIRKTSIGEVIEELSVEEAGQLRSGYLCIGEVPPLDNRGMPQTNKHFESVFEDTGKLIDANVSESVIEEVKYLLSEYNDPAVNHNVTGNGKVYKGVAEAISKGVLPVWYNANTGNISLAAIGRIRFKKTMGDLMGVKSKCTERSKLCPACRLFGMVEGNESVGSSVRITGATLINEIRFIKDVTIKELGSPKMSYLPFYAEKNGERTDSYDYEGVTLKGRKYYWHNTDKSAYRTTEKTNRNATMELIDSGAEFGFDVYFDCISKEQLEELKWTLTLGDNEKESKYCHKIGHGKPIGLGSVKIIITNEVFRGYEINTGYKLSASKEVEIADIKASAKIKNDLLNIHDISAIRNSTVSYPYITNSESNDNNTAPHKWFSSNLAEKGAGFQKLPSIDETVNGIRLFSYNAVHGTKGWQRKA